jgi:hypothetical protein
VVWEADDTVLSWCNVPRDLDQSKHLLRSNGKSRNSRKIWNGVTSLQWLAVFCPTLAYS